MPGQPGSDRCRGRDEGQLASKSSTDREAALATLRELRKKFPYSHFVTFGLAEEAEKAKKLDEAIALYAEVVALPLLERLLEFEWTSRPAIKEVRPGDTLARAVEDRSTVTPRVCRPTWTASMPAAVDDLAKATDVARCPNRSGRSVLCELFTNVRADAAVAVEVLDGGPGSSAGSRPADRGPLSSP